MKYLKHLLYLTILLLAVGCVLRSACSADIRTLCAGVAPGGGRIMQCIANRGADLSPACKDVLVPFMVR
mgnify:CR=1 FL=1